MTTSTMSHQTYKRRVQLDTWKELIHSTHDFKRPVKDHLESIEKLVSKLESNGFTWSKDSVLGMLFQIGLPDQSPTSFAHTNDILDLQSIHQPNHVISADQVKEVILSEEIRMKSPKLSLLDLPLSLFPQILHELAGGSISSKTHLTMTRHPEGPAMNRWWDLDAAHKIRSLASVNRHLRQVCMPFMWKSLDLPGKWSIRPDKIIQLILPENGHHVECLSIRLSQECYACLYSLLEDIWTSDDYKAYRRLENEAAEKRNQKVEDRIEREAQNVNTESFGSLLQLCPNLQMLKIESPTYEAQTDHPIDFEFGLEEVINTIIPLLKHSKLRHLDWNNQGRPSFPKDALKKLLDSLPLLESFTFNNMPKAIRPIGEPKPISFGAHLARLSSLSELRLTGFESLGASWSLQSWSPSLTSLELVNCQHLTPALAHQFIHNFSAHLKRLKLHLTPSDLNTPNNNHLPVLHYWLPELITLNLRGDHDLLNSFTNCLNLRYISLIQPDLKVIGSIYQLLSESDQWSALQHLEIQLSKGRGVTILQKDLKPLKSYCTKHDIELNVFK